MYTDVHSSIIHGGQDIEATKVSYNEWLDKEDVVHIYNGILLTFKKRWNMAICDNIDEFWDKHAKQKKYCLLYTSPSPRD